MLKKDENFLRSFEISYNDSLPRDRKDEVDEMVLLVKEKIMSRKTASEELGLKNYDKELDEIEKEDEVLAPEMGAKDPKQGGDKNTFFPSQKRKMNDKDFSKS
jgi:hypothetical protein